MNLELKFFFSSNYSWKERWTIESLLSRNISQVFKTFRFKSEKDELIALKMRSNFTGQNLNVALKVRIVLLKEIFAREPGLEWNCKTSFLFSRIKLSCFLSLLLKSWYTSADAVEFQPNKNKSIGLVYLKPKRKYNKEILEVTKEPLEIMKI